MSWLHGLRHRLGTLLRPGRYHEELLEEMADHEARDVRYQGAEGARRRFGSGLRHREATRDLTWLRPLDALRQDVGTAWRAAVRRPWTSGVIIATLALGIGANAAAFGILDLLYLRPPAGVRDPGTLRTHWIQYTRTADGEPFWSRSMNYPTARVLREASGRPDSVAAFTTDNALHLGRRPGGPRVRVVFASANYFAVLGVGLTAGRRFSEAEDRFGAAANVALVSEAFRRRELGDQPIIGRVITIGPRDYTVIGMVEPAFRGLDLQPADVWLPLAALPQPAWMREPWWESVNMNAFRLVERGGHDAAEVAARATDLVRRHNRESGESNPDTLMRAAPGPLLEARGPARPGHQTTIATRLAAVTAIVLLIAWANVVNLLLTRALDRRREIALRVALGISRARLIRILVIEALGFAGAAAGAAVFVAWAGGSVLRDLLLPGIEWTFPAFGWRVGAFAGAVALVSGLAAGIVPGWQASRPGLTDALRNATAGGRQRSRLAAGLVVAQAGLSMILLVGAALFVQSLANVRAVDLGLDPDRLLFASVDFAEGEAPPAANLTAVYRDVMARLRSRPDVEAVARAAWEPMMGFRFLRFFTDTDSSESFQAQFPAASGVTPEFFAAAGLTLRRGAGFTAGEPRAEVVVNEAMAVLVWPGREALGQCLRITLRTNPCHIVTGVVENANQNYVIESRPEPQFYLPLGVPPFATAGVLTVRAAPERLPGIAADLRRDLAAAFPAGLPVTRRMTDNLEPEYRPWRLGASLFAAMSGLALLVALLGIYSSVSFAVSRRTHEFAVRSALGARIADVLRQVVTEGVRPVALGIGLGTLVALALGRLVASMLFGVTATEPWIFAATAIALLGAGALAALLPARRAARVDAMTVLKAD